MYRQGTGYTALYTCFYNWFQSVLTGTDYTALYACLNDWLQSVPVGTCYTAMYTCFNYWLQSVRLVLATQSGTLASTTGYRVYRLVLATQPCTLASTTEYSVPAGSGYTALYTGFNLPVTKSTNRVLATQSLLYSASPQLVTYKNIYIYIYRPVAVKFIGDPSLPVFCRLRRITGYSKMPGMESWYRTELPKVNLATEES